MEYVQVEPNSLKMRVDEETMKFVTSFGFDKEQLMKDLELRIQTRATVAYYLQLDDQAQQSQNKYLRTELSEASQARLQHPSGMMLPGRDSRGGCVPPVVQIYKTESVHVLKS